MTTITDDQLWKPFTEEVEIAGLHLQNRLVMAPMTRRKCPQGLPTEEVAQYYARRADTLGMVITEGVYVDHPTAGTLADVPRFGVEGFKAAWAPVIDSVHAKGAKILPQLWHLGSVRRAGTPPFPDAPAMAPSGLSLSGKQIAEPASLKMIEEVVAAFGTSAKEAKEAGFDGVEIHAAHGYLVDQFLWSQTNRRDDFYGGSFANRRRFLMDIIEEIRAQVGKNYPLQVRFSQWKGGNYDASIVDSPKQLEELLDPMVSAGVDIFHPSTRRFWLPAFEGSDKTLAGWTRQITGKPTIAVGHVGVDTAFLPTASEKRNDFDLRLLAKLFEEGEFDLVAIGRALLADPRWVQKTLSGKADQVNAYTKETEEVYF